MQKSARRQVIHRVKRMCEEFSASNYHVGRKLGTRAWTTVALGDEMDRTTQGERDRLARLINNTCFAHFDGGARSKRACTGRITPSKS